MINGGSVITVELSTLIHKLSKKAADWCAVLVSAGRTAGDDSRAPEMMSIIVQ
jgi:hypothetical protein